MLLSLVRDGPPAARAWSVNVYVWVLDLFFLTWSVPIGLVVLGHSTDLLGGTSSVWLAVLLGMAFLTLNDLLGFRLLWVKAIAARSCASPGSGAGAPVRSTSSTGWRRHRPALAARPRPAGAAPSPDGGALPGHVPAFYVIVAGLGGNPPLLPTLAAVQLPMVTPSCSPRGRSGPAGDRRGLALRRRGNDRPGGRGHPRLAPAHLLQPLRHRARPRGHGAARPRPRQRGGTDAASDARTRTRRTTGAGRTGGPASEPPREPSARGGRARRR